jgi:adenosylmethionine-8-amino-7-oxononanoate aminotransferase
MSSAERDVVPDFLWRPMTQHRTLIEHPPRKMVRGSGCFLEDEDGKRYLDAVAGLWCVNAGYGRRELADTASEQMAELGYLSPMFTHGPAVELAERLQSMLGYSAHVYFSSSGSEANETAFKIARQYHLQAGEQGQRRYKIISRYRAYHGNTMGSMAATGQAERKMGYEPTPAGFLHVMPPYPYRANPKLTAEEHGEECIRQLEETIIHEGAETVAAFIMEPVISGGGVLVPPDNYLPRVREICDRYGVLLILDEVVSGFGRTGRLFGQEHWHTQADIVTLAKGLASGYMPIAATIAKRDIFESFLGEPNELRHFRQVNTFGAHPVSAAVALRNIDIVENEKLTENSASIGDYLKQQLLECIGDDPRVGEVRGKGLLVGAELVADRETREPLADAMVGAVVGHCMRNGVIIGRNGNTVPGRCNVLVLAPPLVISKDEANQVVAAIEAALASLPHS